MIIFIWIVHLEGGRLLPAWEHFTQGAYLLHVTFSSLWMINLNLLLIILKVQKTFICFEPNFEGGCVGISKKKGINAGGRVEKQRLRALLCVWTYSPSVPISIKKLGPGFNPPGDACICEGFAFLLFLLFLFICFGSDQKKLTPGSVPSNNGSYQSTESAFISTQHSCRVKQCNRRRLRDANIWWNDMVWCMGLPLCHNILYVLLSWPSYSIVSGPEETLNQVLEEESLWRFCITADIGVVGCSVGMVKRRTLHLIKGCTSKLHSSSHIITRWGLHCLICIQKMVIYAREHWCISKTCISICILKKSWGW